VKCARAQRSELEKLRKHWNKRHLAMHKPELKRLDQAFADAKKTA
jgi:hypothetical protein